MTFVDSKVHTQDMVGSSNSVDMVCFVLHIRYPQSERVSRLQRAWIGDVFVFGEDTGCHAFGVVYQATGDGTVSFRRGV